MSLQGGYPMTWDQVKAEWNTMWTGWSDTADQAWQAVVEATQPLVEAMDPRAVTSAVEQFVALLDELASLLDRWDATLAQLPGDQQAAEAQVVAQYKAAYNTYAAGFWPHVEADTSVQGVAGPWLVLIPGIAVTAVAAAWAVGNLSELGATVSEVYLRIADLDARVQASKDGRVLQPATVPDQLNAAGADPEQPEGWGLWLGLGALAAAAGVGVAVWSSRK